MGRKHDEYLSVDDGHSEARQLVAEEYVNYEDAEAVKLQNAILSLPIKQQLAFNMRYYDEMDYDEIAKEIMEDKVDGDRIYILGGSMGGTGTWSMASAYPGLFAAAMPVAGNPSKSIAENVS